MIEVQCTSCHTRYRIDEQVLPEGTPTFKCSRCGHVFSFDPRNSGPLQAQSASSATGGLQPVARQRAAARAVSPPPAPSAGEAPAAATLPADAAKAPDAAVAAVNPVPAPSAEPRPSAEASTADLLSRPFANQHEDAKPGENLTFDFRDEDPAPHAAGFSVQEPVAEEPKWQVGDDPSMAFQSDSVPAADAIGLSESARPARRRARARRARSDDDFVNEEAAPIYNRAVTHSARFS